MAYNKARAEKQWLKWKEAEEQKLRELGVDEETIQRLHTYDWAQFNKERQYLQRQVEWSQQRAPVPAAAGGMVTVYRLGVSAGFGIARRRYRSAAGQHRGYKAAAYSFQRGQVDLANHIIQITGFYQYRDCSKDRTFRDCCQAEDISPKKETLIGE